MKLSDLQSILSRVQQAVGDVEVILAAAEGEAGSFIKDVEVHLNPGDPTAAGTATIIHGDAPDAPTPEAEAPAEGEPAADSETGHAPDSTL